MVYNLFFALPAKKYGPRFEKSRLLSLPVQSGWLWTGGSETNTK